MFLDFYKLREQPFGVTPDPRFLFLGASHREALASLFCGIENDRGFMALIAEPGFGKTTLTFQLLDKFQRTARTAFVFQTQCNSRELLQYVLEDLEIGTSRTDIVSMHNKLNEVLYQEKLAGRRVILAIDEAQNLSPEVLETVRLLSNFETHNSKLIHILLIGQPQLAVKLAEPDLAQLAQRIAMYVHLEGFNYEDTSNYMTHRLSVAGYAGEPIFTPAATRAIAERSQGNPRNINRLCFGALSIGCALGRKRIDSDIIEEAAVDLHLARANHDVTNPLVIQAKPAAPEPFLQTTLSYHKMSGRRLIGIVCATAAVVAALGLGIALKYPSINKAWVERVWHHTAVGVTSSLGINDEVALTAASAEQKEPPGRPIAGEEPVISMTHAPGADNEVVRVVVQQGETLRQITLRTLGRYSTKLISEIQSLNPTMTDPDHIEPNQQILLPKSQKTTVVQGETAQIDGTEKN